MMEIILSLFGAGLLFGFWFIGAVICNGILNAMDKEKDYYYEFERREARENNMWLSVIWPFWLIVVVIWAPIKAAQWVSDKSQKK